MTETGTCQARQEEQTHVIKRESVFQNKTFSEYDRQYNRSKITYLFGQAPNDPWTGTGTGGLRTTAVNHLCAVSHLRS